MRFVANGKKPWSEGYALYKEREISRVLTEREFNLDVLPTGYGFRIDERIIEYPWLLSRIPVTEGRFLDAGSSLNYDYLLSHPALSSKRIFISTLAPEGYAFWNRGISYVFEDMRYLCYRDDYFDWVASISTVEHIGLDNTMLYTDDGSKKENLPEAYLEAIKECRRVLKPGGVCYISIPYGRYRNHEWFQVFDGPMVDRMIDAFAPSSVSESHFRYEPQGWRISSREESKDGTCFDIHKQKTYDEDFAAFSRAIVCLELVK